MGRDLYGHLVSSTSYPPWFYLNNGRDITKGLLEHIQRILPGPLFHDTKSIIYKPIRDRLFATSHHLINKSGNSLAIIL